MKGQPNPLRGSSHPLQYRLGYWVDRYTDVRFDLKIHQAQLLVEGIDQTREWLQASTLFVVFHDRVIESLIFLTAWISCHLCGKWPKPFLRA